MGLDVVLAGQYISRSLGRPSAPAIGTTMTSARARRNPSSDAANESERAQADVVPQSRDEQTTWAFEILFGHGALDKDDAVRRVEDAFVSLGLTAPSEAETGGAATRQAIEKAIDAGVKQGRFDKPKRGQIRAIRTDAKEYSPEDWMLCLTSALDEQPIDREAALRFAAYWAASNMGLAFVRLQRGGAILTGLDAALETALQRGRFVDAGAGCVRKV